MTTPTLSPNQLQEEEELLTLLKELGNLRVEYPPELSTTTRAAILARAEQKKRDKGSHPSPAELLYYTSVR